MGTYGTRICDWQERINVDRMRKERVQKARTEMEKAGVGAILCFNPANTRYLTGTYTPNWAREGFTDKYVLFPRTSGPILYEVGLRTLRLRKEMPWLEGRVKGAIPFEWLISQGLPVNEFVEDIKRMLSESGVEKEPLAIDMPVASLEMKQWFKDVGIEATDGHRLMLKARLIKTEDEIVCLETSASFAEKAFEAMRANIRPGIKECDLVALGLAATLQEGDDAPVDGVMASGPNTNPNMMIFSDRAVRPGELIFADFAAIKFLGYCTCYYRTFCCGKPTQVQKEIYKECYDLLYKVIPLLKAGVTTDKVAEAMPSAEAVGAEHGWQAVETFVVHGIGLSVHENPRIKREISLEHPVTLQENMTVAAEVWVGRDNPKQGVRLEEEIVIRKDGPEVISLWPIEEITEAWI